MPGKSSMRTSISLAFLTRSVASSFIFSMYERENECDPILSREHTFENLWWVGLHWRAYERQVYIYGKKISPLGCAMGMLSFNCAMLDFSWT